MILLLIPPVLLACLVILELFKSRKGKLLLSQITTCLVAAPVLLALGLCGAILFKEVPRFAFFCWAMDAALAYAAFRVVTAIERHRHLPL